MVSTYNALPVNNWAPLQMYGKDTPVENCTSGTCIKGYLWYNAYIPANLINARNAAGRCTGVCGIPSGYAPIETPLYPTPAAGGSNPLYETNNVFITLKNGSQVQTSLNTNLHPATNTFSGRWRITRAEPPSRASTLPNRCGCVSKRTSSTCLMRKD